MAKARNHHRINYNMRVADLQSDESWVEACSCPDTENPVQHAQRTIDNWNGRPDTDLVGHRILLEITIQHKDGTLERIEDLEAESLDLTEELGNMRWAVE